ncbi:MAG: ATP-binding protein [Thermoleophilaceae bacterium]
MAAVALQQAQRALRLPADASQLVVAREFADDAAARFGFDEVDRYQFKLAVSEAVANAIEHGRPYPDGTIALQLTEEGDLLTMEVYDAGRFTTNLVEEGALPERGRGLAFMTVFVDELDIVRADDHTAVRLSKRRV